LLLSLSGCEYIVQPLGGAEGRTLVYAYVGKPGTVNTGAPNGGIICTSIGCIVVDPMLSPDVGKTMADAAAAKSRIFWDNLHGQHARTLPPPVLYVFNTTYRASHTFGNQVFDKADILSTPKAKARMDAVGRDMREELRDVWKIPGLDTHAVTSATLTVEGTLTLDTREVKVQFISMGDCVGEGDAVVYLPGQKVLFAGDLVVPHFMPYGKGRTPTVRRWIEALKKLEGWEIEHVVPGHGEVGGKAAIGAQREFLEKLVEEVSAAIKAGKTIDQAAQTVKLPKYSSWTRYDEWLPENVRIVYRELSSDGSKTDKADAGDGPNVATTEGGAGAVKPADLDPHDAFRGK
jgi:glyoxylase-like metal-dependent hydrolase (beta-lactamase superfamily II)